MTQGYVSKLERQDDMLLSNLYAYVEALGGEVEIRAKFPDHEVQIRQFREIEKLKAALAPTAKRKKSACTKESQCFHDTGLRLRTRGRPMLGRSTL